MTKLEKLLIQYDQSCDGTLEDVKKAGRELAAHVYYLYRSGNLVKDVQKMEGKK